MNERMTAALGEFVFAADERPLAEIVLDLLRARGWKAADGRVVHRGAWSPAS